ncbi:hypothetical protein EON63_08980 [archaeon]|nr:MAG: hypothetical protein EON63_08980 [archaeon]
MNKEVTNTDDRLEILLRLKTEVSQDTAAETQELLSLIDREVNACTHHTPYSLLHSPSYHTIP